jgi:hypothetical protein
LNEKGTDLFSQINPPSTLTSPLLATLHNVVRMTHPSVEAWKLSAQQRIKK